jgi:hypothetical protein
MWQVWQAERVLTGLGAEALRGNNPLGKTRRRWEDNFKMNLKEVGTGGIDWIHLAQDSDRRRGRGFL